MIVVSDTSPLNYLILVGQADVLRTLYGRVIVPDVVKDELGHARSPVAVKDWIAHLPEWIEVRSTIKIIPTKPGLDAGEVAAMQLALELQAELVLIDDQPARVEAQRLGLPVTGTLGVLMAAAVLRLLDIEAVLSRLLSETNFRLKQHVADRAIAHVKTSLAANETGRGET